MKKGSTSFLKIVISLIALVSLVVLVKFPQLEGRAVNLDLLSIYRDPFIIYIYVASVPFFLALYQSFRLMSYIEANQIFSRVSLKAIQNIKNCALAITGFALGAEAWLFLFERHTSDDMAGGVMMGVFIMFVSVVIATIAATLQKVLQHAVDLKSENDLTV